MPTNFLEYVRYALYAAVAFIGLNLYQTWETAHPKPMIQSTATTSTSSATHTNNYIPQVTKDTQNNAVATAMSSATSIVPDTQNRKMIHIVTDVMDVTIDPLGGNIDQVNLLKYPAALHSTEPTTLLNDSPATKYVAQSGLVSTSGPDSVEAQALYTSDATSYTMAKDQNEMQVQLHWKNAAGLTVNKIFTLKRDDYEIGMTYQINNQTPQPWEGNVYLQIMRKNTPPSKTGLMSLATYFGAAISSPDKPFEKVTFKEMGEQNLSRTIPGGWIAMIQHYFVSAWVPDKNISSQYFTHITDDNLYTIGMLNPKIVAKPGATISTQANFYAGPSVTNRLEKVAPGLQLTIDFGWFWFISSFIFWMMQKIYNVIGNWGWSIVLVTLIIKIAFYQLSAKSYRSMSGLKKLQPRLAALKERYGEDKQQFTKATIELYKQEKVNPMSGCLPILIQIPVFIGLYWVLLESVELRQAPFILWIHDLTQKDPYYVLPVLMGISMFLQQRLNPPPTDPMQAKVMMFMPIVFTAMFLSFPAGLMLYWFVNNGLSFLQQWYIMRSINKNDNVTLITKK